MSNRSVRSVLLPIVTVLIACSAAEAPTRLDAELARIMQGREGTAVLLQVRGNRILASYRPEVAARRVVLPGSAIKPFTLLALLESGKVEHDEKFLCRRNVRVAGRNLTCSHPQTGQPLDAVAALAYSCNDYFTSMALRLTSQELHDAIVRAGLAKPTGLVPKEANGSVRLATTREQRQLQAVGEFGIRTTPLEMVAAYRALALRKFADFIGPGDPWVFAGLEASTTYGMSRLAQPKGLRVAGKTGTSRADEGPWTHGWFVGFAPADKPEVAVVVFLEHGTGPADAAPLAAQILQAWMAEPK